MDEMKDKAKDAGEKAGHWFKKYWWIIGLVVVGGIVAVILLTDIWSSVSGFLGNLGSPTPTASPTGGGGAASSPVSSTTTTVSSTSSNSNIISLEDKFKTEISALEDQMGLMQNANKANQTKLTRQLNGLQSELKNIQKNTGHLAKPHVIKPPTQHVNTKVYHGTAIRLHGAGVLPNVNQVVAGENKKA
jgi:cytoskeletal protein RodZ